MADELSIDSKALIFATLADVYLSSGMLDEAISILKDGLARNPNYTLAKIILGRAYYMKGETEEALKLLEAIYPEAQESENENLFLGHCYKRLTDFDKARKHYEAVLRINPDNKDAKKELTTLGIKPTEVPVGKIKVKHETEVPVREIEISARGTEGKPELEIAEQREPPPEEVEIRPTIEIKSTSEAVHIKEVILPEVDITRAQETPEPEMVIQEPTVKITIPPPVSETIVKGEIEIVLPFKEEPVSEVPVSGAEVIQKTEVPVSGAEVIQKTEVPVAEKIKEIEATQKAEIPPSGTEFPVSGAEVIPEIEVPISGTEIPPRGEAEKPPEILRAESSVSDEVKRRIEALALANAQAAQAEKEEAKSKAKPEEIPAAKPEEPAPPPLFAEEMKVPEPVVSPTAETGTPFDRLNIPMEKLLSLKTVNAAFISARDGLLIKNYAEKREDIEEISALVAAIFNEAFESFKYLNEGPVEKIIIEKSRETICVITAGESLLCVITQPEAKPGLIFVYARKIIDEIREVLG